jgi:hypothetical protein
MDEKESSMKAQTGILIGIASALLGLSAVLKQTTEPVVPQWASEGAPSAVRDGKYVFILFYEEGDVRKLTMWQTMDAALAKRPGQARAVNIRASDPPMKTVVDRYGVDRSSLPFVLAIAPNSAVTGAFALELTEQDVASAFVSPGQATCMKEEQTRQLVSLLVAPSTALWPTNSTWCWLTSRPATSNPTIASRCCTCFTSSAARREQPSLLADHCLLADQRSCLDESLLETCRWRVRTDARWLDTVRCGCGTN